MLRRGFLGSLIAGAATLALDPEKLLWVPGSKTIFTPATRIFSPRLVVGIAKESAPAGGFVRVQVYGKAIIWDSYSPGARWQTNPGLSRRCKALLPIRAGDLVYSDEVDYGDAPLWTQPENVQRLYYS